MSGTFLGFVAFVAGVALALVDGRRGIVWAAAVSALALVLPVFQIAASEGALLILATAAAVGLFWYASRVAGRYWPQMGPDPTISLGVSKGSLFGPRSVRAVSSVVSLIAASWISLNIPVAGSGYGSGVLFAVSYVTIVAGFRILLAHSVEDLAIGCTGVSLACAATVLLEGGAAATAAAGSVGCLAPVAAIVVGWMSGRSDRSDSRRGTEPADSGRATA